MAEAVTSPTNFPLRACAADEADRRREQMDDLEELVERLIDRLDRQDKELRDVKAERDALREEVKRRKGE